MGLDDPRAQVALFGVAGPAAIAFVATLIAAVAFKAAKKPESGETSPRAGLGAAFGLAGAFVLANLGMDGLPEGMPVAAAEWALPLVAVAGVVACVQAVCIKGTTRHVVCWLGRAAIIAAFVFGPMARTRQNFWEGIEAVYWIVGVAGWFVLAFAASDRTVSKSSPRGHALVVMATAGGLVPVIFGAGVTVQSQVAGAVAAAAGGIVAATFLMRKSIPASPAMGTVFIAWLGAMLTLSWQFVAEMAWWEFGVVASIPLLVAAVDVIPRLRGLSTSKRLVVRLGVVIATTAAVSGHHVPGLIEQLGGGGSDPADDYWNSL
ncbi:MAG: hypothetical protein AAFY46_12920 [Planctomycetota bacterium]